MDAWFWVWFVLAAVLSIAELFTAGFFMLPFGIGAGTAAVLNAVGLSLAWQWVAFLGVSVVSLALLRHFADRITHESPQKTGGDRLIGKRGIVVESLDHARGQGRVRVEREEWRADAPGFEPLSEGTPVTVIRIEGTHLVVQPVDANVSPQAL